MFNNDKSFEMLSSFDKVMADRNGSSAAYILASNIRIDGEVYKLEEVDEDVIMKMFEMLWGDASHNATIDNFYWTRLLMQCKWHYDVKIVHFTEDELGVVQEAITTFASSFDAYADFDDSEIDEHYEKYHTAEPVKFDLPKAYRVPLSAPACEMLNWTEMFFEKDPKYKQLLDQLVWEFIMHGPMAPIVK